MSNYKVELYVGTGYVGSDVREEIDLIDDWGYDEEQAESIFEESGEDYERFMDEDVNQWIWKSIESSANLIKESN